MFFIPRENGGVKLGNKTKTYFRGETGGYLPTYIPPWGFSLLSISLIYL